MKNQIEIDGKYIIERIEHMAAYRIYEKGQPQQTCAYCDNLAEAIELINERESKK